MKQFSWELKFGFGLVGLSLCLYSVHYAVFRDLHYIMLLGLINLAFLPVSVLVVTLIINRLLAARERYLRLEKLNMLIGVFFSSTGTQLLSYFCTWNPKIREFRTDLSPIGTWSKSDFWAAIRKAKEHPYHVQINAANLSELRDFLMDKSDFLLRLLENPHLLEHEAFSEVLRAVFHLDEELTCRNDLKDLPETDLEHLGGDIKRVYALLVQEWLKYLEYLKREYPYLFSLAIRLNPLDSEPSVIVKGLGDGHAI